MGLEKTLSPWKCFIRAIQLSGLALLGAGWSTPPRPLSTNVSHQVLTEQSRQMSALYEARSRAGGDRLSIELDLSDDAQYGFVLNRLHAAGKNERNSPELFNKLARLRRRALSRGNRQPAAAAPAEQPIWCDHYLIVKPPVSLNDGKSMRYEPYVHVSCQGGATYVYADIVAYETNQTETQSRVVASKAGEEYGGGTNFIDVGTAATVNVADGRLLRLESIALAIDDVTGRDVSTYTVARTSVALREEGGFTLLHPRENVPNSTADIVLCQLRGGADCDYAVAGYSNGVLMAYPPTPTGVAASRSDAPGVLSPADYWEFSAPFNNRLLYIPVRTEIKAGARNYLQCKVHSYSYGRLRLHTDTGVVCSNTVDFKALLPVGNYAATFNHLADTSYSINQSDPENCGVNKVLNRATTFTITILGKARCTSAEGIDYLEPFYKSQAIDGRALTTQRLFFRNSCMAEGTRIQLAGGHEVPVEQVKLGDKILAGAGRAALTVTDVARGNEMTPFVHLRDSLGHQVTLTEMHPVITASGQVVAARDLKVRDQVRTDKGVASLTAVKRVPVNGKRVFNLKLGTAEELAGVDALGRTMFAGGFLVGDLAMQDELERPANEPVDVLARLPKAWHQDYLNARRRSAE